MTESIDYARRFGGVARLHGESGLAQFKAASICVVGLGGVGSWAAEALARNAIGRLTLIDLDMVAESNTNRQLHALGDNWGRAKIEVMAERIRAINPRCTVNLIEDFATPENLPALLAGHDAVLDAIDAVPVKIAMAVHCRQMQQTLVMCGGSGGKRDPSQIRYADLARTEQDPLLAKVRAKLRKEYGFPGLGKKGSAPRKFGIEVVYSQEPLQMPVLCETSDGAPQGLSCAGYGSDVCVTASVGMLAAARVLAQLSLKKVHDE